MMSMAAIDIHLQFIQGLPNESQGQSREQKLDATLAVTSKCTEVYGNVTIPNYVLKYTW